MRRIMRTTILSTAVLAGALGLAPVANATPADARAAYDCPANSFCIYSDWNGKGERCAWTAGIKQDTVAECGFIQRGKNVRSVWNWKHRSMAYFRSINLQNRMGTQQIESGSNTQGNYQIRSFILD